MNECKHNRTNSSHECEVILGSYMQEEVVTFTFSTLRATIDP